MAIKKKEQLENTEYDKGVVIYSDGGSRGNGFSGWGVHGYYYDLSPPNKGSGNVNNVLTTEGYVSKKEYVDSKYTVVKPINYIDGFGSISGYSTNNAAELLATSNAMFIASKYDIKNFKLLTDSKYVVDGINEYMPKWKANNWVKSDGTEVANKAEWVNVEEQLNKLNEKNVNITINWIKAHAGHIGNELADRYATLGVYNAMSDKIRAEIDYQPAQGYWNPQVDRHPFLYNKKAYFLTREGSNKSGTYYLGDTSKDDDLDGVLQTDGSICYVELNTPNKLIEEVINIQRFFSPNTDIITYIHLNKLFNPSVVRDINRFGHGSLYRHNKYRIDLNFSDGEPITRGLVPPKLAMRTINKINELAGLLKEYKENSNGLSVTDITNSLYELNKKDELILKADITANTDNVKVEISYEGDKKYNLSLFFGSDIPSRNNLKKLEKKTPRVEVITWMDSPECFRYVTVISVDDGIGIWSSIASNMKFIDCIKKAK